MHFTNVQICAIISDDRINDGNITPTTPQMRLILDHIANNGYITDDKIGSLLCLKKTRIFNLTKQMRKLGLIVVDGRGKNKKYLQK